MKKNLYSRNIHFALSYTAARFFLFFIFFFISTFAYSQTSKQNISDNNVYGGAQVVTTPNSQQVVNLNSSSTPHQDEIVIVGNVIVYNADSNENLAFKKTASSKKSKDAISDLKKEQTEKLKEIVQATPKEKKFKTPSFLNSKDSNTVISNILIKRNIGIINSINFYSKVYSALIVHNKYDLKLLQLSFVPKIYKEISTDKHVKLIGFFSGKSPPQFFC